MDIFLEKIVTKKKTFTDSLIAVGTIFGTIILVMLSFTIQILVHLGLSVFLSAGFIAHLYHNLIFH